MGSMEFKINGTLIQHIFLQNMGVIDKGKYLYTYEFYEYQKDIVKGEVFHKRDDGMTTLCRLILEDVEQRRKIQ